MDTTSDFFGNPATHPLSGEFTRAEVIASGPWFRLTRAMRAGRWFVVKTPVDPDNIMAEMMLRKEYDALAPLSHPSIVGVVEWADVKGIGRGIVEEWIDGSPLDSFIASERPDEKERRRIVAAIADAIDYIHARRLVHRDIKPANIMITKAARQPVVIDFGLADGAVFATLKEGAGTPSFASPGQTAGTGEATAADDIYSLGALMRAMWPEGMPRRWRRASARCMAADPAGRPASASEAVALLAPARHTGAYIAAGAAALIVAGAIWWGAASRDGSEAASVTDTVSDTAVDTIAAALPAPEAPDTAAAVAVIPAPAPTAATPLPSDPHAMRVAIYDHTTLIASRHYADWLRCCDTVAWRSSYRLINTDVWYQSALAEARQWLRGRRDGLSPATVEAMQSAVTEALDDFYRQRAQQTVTAHQTAIANIRAAELRRAEGKSAEPRIIRQELRDSLGRVNGYRLYDSATIEALREMGREPY